MRELDLLGGNISTTVDNPANSVGQHTSIAIAPDGLPVISHYNSTANALRVTKCGNAACTAGNVSTNADTPANSVGLLTSIAIGADGLPVVSHRDDTAGALRVTKCGNAACSAGNVSTTVDDPPTGAGFYPSLAIGADGLPVISHGLAPGGSRSLRVTKCGNPACTAGNVSTSLDGVVSDQVRYTSIAIGRDMLPVISYQNWAGGGLGVIKCGTQTCR
ncbi:MAG: hypothetical protein R2712_23770 [Vicinamibacterales bacterium]